MAAHSKLSSRVGFGERARAGASDVASLCMQDGWRGTLRAGEVRASVRVEHGGWLRVCQPLAGAVRAEELLVATGALPGNVRYAGPRGARVLLADTWLAGESRLEGESSSEGEAHLARSLERILAGLQAGLRSGGGGIDGAGRVRSSSRGRREESAPPLAFPALESAIAALGWDPSAVVRLQESWELRPRLEGAPQPVRAELAGARLHLQRCLARAEQLERLPARSLQALAELALRLNEQLRLARLVRAADGLRVEAHLHAEELAPAHLARAVRAVAAASVHARLPLALLSEHERVARHYADAFCAPDPLLEPSLSEAQP